MDELVWEGINTTSIFQSLLLVKEVVGYGINTTPNNISSVYVVNEVVGEAMHTNSLNISVFSSSEEVVGNDMNTPSINISVRFIKVESRRRGY